MRRYSARTARFPADRGANYARVNTMLRITKVAGPSSEQTLKLEGRLVGPWVDELLDTCSALLTGSSRIRLELSGVAFVDAAGAQLLRDLILRGVEMDACSNYIAELIRGNK
jgi:ABC-type transporter Mla MlaB component